MSNLSIEKKVEALKFVFASSKTKGLKWRLDQLKALRNLLTENVDEFCDALNKDLGRCKFEASSFDVLPVVLEIDFAIKNLKQWMKPVHTAVPGLMAPSTAEVVCEPYGVCLIVGAFNFPVALTLSPLIGAIAAGNCAVIKPSEIAVSTEQLIQALVPKYLDAECFTVVCGGVEVSSKLLAQKWDKIFFTGSIRVGKIFMKAAAEHLTPLSLELGGKSPTIIDSSVTDMELVCRRIAWGKCLNAGQICIAPDYVFVHKKVHTLFLETMKKTITDFYTTNPQNSEHYCRLITKGHCQRVIQLIETCKQQKTTTTTTTGTTSTGTGSIYYGGDHNVENRYIAPTIITDLSLSHPIMQEEIFGPVLPVFPYEHEDEIIHIVNQDTLQKPLALYIFSKNRIFIDKLINSIQSGGVVVNDVLFHFANIHLPFGGVGASGLGSYHGKFSFDAFSHHRSILRRDDHFIFDVSARYPPYTDLDYKVFNYAAKYLPTLPSITLSKFLGYTVLTAGALALGLGLGLHYRK